MGSYLGDFLGGCVAVTASKPRNNFGLGSLAEMQMNGRQKRWLFNVDLRPWNFSGDVNERRVPDMKRNV